MTDQKQSKGEGDYVAGKKYQDEKTKFVEENDVEAAAERAKSARESAEERQELDKAEEAARAKAKEFDPQVKRNDKAAG